MRSWWVIGCLLVLTASAVAESAELPRISDYRRTVWTVEQGSPGSTHAIVQTRDGWLWLGGPRGLTRFDGVQFETVPIQGRDVNAGNVIYTLFADSSGDLWIGYMNEGMSRYSNGAFRHFGVDDGVPLGSVFEFARDAEGRLWATSSSALLRFDGTRWHAVDVPIRGAEALPHTLHLDSRGTLWMAHEGLVFFLPRGEAHIRRAQFATHEYVSFMRSPDGRSWYDDARGAYLLPEQEARPGLAGIDSTDAPRGAVIDRQNHVWTVRGGELLRHRIKQGADQVPIATSPFTDRFGPKDGLSGSLHSMNIDREGNVWLATSAGIERFRHANLRRVAFDETPPPAGRFSFAAADDGAMWIGTEWGYTQSSPSNGVWTFDGKARRMASSQIPRPNALHRDREGHVWIAGPSGVVRMSHGRIDKQFPSLPEEAHGLPIHLLVVDSEGAPWITVRGRHLYAFRDGAWRKNGNVRDMPEPRPASYARDPAGRLWFGYRDNTVVVIDAQGVIQYGPEQGLEIGHVLAMSAEDHVIAAGPTRIAVLIGERFHTLESPGQIEALEGVTGIVQTADGDIWLNGSRGLVRIARQDFDQALRTGNYHVPVEVFDHEDGYPGIGGLGTYPTLVEGADGKLWIAGTTGAAWLDPRHLRRNEVLPPVQIRSVIAGDESHSARAPLTLRAGTQDVQISYTALSLSRPERARFRYRLNGYDQAWIDAGTRREAFYTNLAPGKYRFQVIAANDSGLWNETGAEVSIDIPPTFLQSKTFIAICVLTGLLMIWGVFAIRIRQITARQRLRFAERLGERERIARELHDTLLQGVQGLLLRFQSAADQMESSETKRDLDQALDQAQSLLAQGRDRVIHLRSVVSPDALGRALTEAADTLSRASGVLVRVREYGASLAPHPVVCEEALRVAIEAMTNAARHASANHIEVELAHTPRELRLTVRDDGRGIDEDILRSGRPGHFGLKGMRERAQRIRGELRITSRPADGTEVSLVVPAHLAYPPKSWKQQVRAWLRPLPAEP